MECPLLQIAREVPQDIAIAAKGEDVSFGTLSQWAGTLALRLKKLGVRENDRLAFLPHPSPLLLALCFAIWRIGATACPLNCRAPEAQIQRELTRLSPKYFIDSVDPWRVTPLRPLFAAADPADVLLFTSGSTGHPKIAAFSREKLLASARAYPVVNLQKGDRWLLSLPLFHVGGWGIVFRSLLARSTIALEERDPKITHLSYVPTQLYRASPVYPNLKAILLGGAPVGHFSSRLPIWVTYGLTEMGSWVLARKNPPQKDGYWFLGKPLSEREIRLEKDGEIAVRGAPLFLGYWEQGQIEAAPDWFFTKDLGRFCEKEGFAIVGRKDWQFISGGENIQPEEIEQKMLEIPQILEAVVVGKKDPEFGYRPVAYARCVDSTFDLKQLTQKLAEHLPKYKIPIALHVVDDLPKKGFKVDRKEIFNWANEKENF